MKRFFQLFANFFQGSVGKILIIANFIICLVIFDWGKFFRYLETPAKINCHIKPISRGGSIDICTSGMFPSIFEPLILLIGLIYLIFVYPSIAMTEIVLGGLKGLFPLLCLETFDIFYIPIFAVVNTFYWLFLGDMIEIAHSQYRKFYPLRKKYLGIFNDF